MAYREMDDVLGEGERESEAIRKLGLWRDRVRTQILLVFAIAGLGAAAAGYWFAQELQFRYNDGIAFVKLNLMIGVVPAWILSMIIGWWIARFVVARRMNAKVAALEVQYELPKGRLAEMADMIRTL
jgi:phosphate/sulfate permease